MGVNPKPGTSKRADAPAGKDQVGFHAGLD
jgi:hypothetical protein